MLHREDEGTIRSEERPTAASIVKNSRMKGQKDTLSFWFDSEIYFGYRTIRSTPLRLFSPFSRCSIGPAPRSAALFSADFVPRGAESYVAGTYSVELVSASFVAFKSRHHYSKLAHLWLDHALSMMISTLKTVKSSSLRKSYRGCQMRCREY